jgi:hypothetical protein
VGKQAHAPSRISHIEPATVCWGHNS